MIVSSAPAKVILCGEHAVVYGHPALAVPVFGLQAYAYAESRSDFRIELLDMDETLFRNDAEHPLVRAVLRVSSVAGVSTPMVSLSVRSGIPVASGLGSGAAVTTALVKVLFEYFLLDADYTKINDIVYEAEKAYHGTPSGIDNTVTVYEQPVFFIKGQPIQTFQVPAQYHFLIGDTGIPSSTKETVAHVRAQLESAHENVQDILNRIHALVNQAHQALATGEHEVLGKLLTENHTQLQNLGVSINELDKLVDAALQTGAYGAKLSGGGGGGNMIALVPEAKKDSVREALLRAGAKHVYETTLGES